MLAFGLTIFSGAFLLFLVQPLIAKFILPWFGGSPAVWTTCMLFFQVLLLGGYAYAHLSIRKLSPRQQVILHLVLLGLALTLLPITPGDHWKPADGSQPTLRILMLLTVCLGLPYLVLSATGPLFQAWFSKSHPGVSPYRLYALSNVGSLLALVAYPFLVEPNLTRRAQAWTWSGGLALFAVCAAWCGSVVWKRAANAAPKSTEVAADSPASPGDAGPSRISPWLWFALPAFGSVLLLAVTNKLCQDIAVIPFLWVLPLSLYLLSFIICFDSPKWYWRPAWIGALTIAFAAVLWIMLGHSLTAPPQSWARPLAWLIEKGDDVGMFAAIGIYLATMFIACMVCHGEVYRLRPAAEKLTGYYLMISAGGAAGGLFVAVVAPFIFKNYSELHVGLFGVAALVPVFLLTDSKSALYRGRDLWGCSLVFTGVLLVGWGLYADAAVSVRSSAEVTRNFYGVLKVNEYDADEPQMHKFMLQHGGTTHGLQFVDEDKRRKPTTYYSGTSGAGRTMRSFPRHPRRVGVVGLGTGSMAVWGREGDYIRFYEINDEVERIAHTRFSYLKDSAAKIEIIHGDARLSMEREKNQELDVIVLDAFSSDAIPVHLLTREAIEIYQRHLKPDGVIAVHISNRYLELQPIVTRLADYFGLTAALVFDNDLEARGDDEDTSGAYTSDWILLTKNKAFLELPTIKEALGERGEFSDKIRMWTDEESNLFRILLF